MLRLLNCYQQKYTEIHNVYRKVIQNQHKLI